MLSLHTLPCSMAIHQRTTEIKSMAIRHGFDSVGIAQAAELTEEAKRLEAWLNQGRHGSMGYMEITLICALILGN